MGQDTCIWFLLKWEAWGASSQRPAGLSSRKKENVWEDESRKRRVLSFAFRMSLWIVIQHNDSTIMDDYLAQ